jgi:hypothetical protein
VLVRPSELMSRAWMKDAADAHARDCPNINHPTSSTASAAGWRRK